MPLTYTGADGIFTHIGKAVKHYNLQETDRTDLITDRDEIIDTIVAGSIGDMLSVVEGFTDIVDSWQSEHSGRKDELVGIATRRIQDSVSVLEIIESGSDIRSILERMFIAMIDDTATIDKSTVTLTVSSAPATNKGNGTAIVSKVLDAYSSPSDSASAFTRYIGLDSELCESQDLRIVCLADSYYDNQAEGSEPFSYETTGPLSPKSLTSLNCINGTVYNLATNGDFESFTSNAPDNWTIQTGTAGTHIDDEPAGANVYHGLKSLKFTGDGALAAIEIRQTLDANRVKAGTAYCVAFRLKADAAIAAGTLEVMIEGTGFTPSASQKVSIAPGSLPTSWTLYNFFTQIPVNRPSDLRIVVKWSGTPTNAKNLYIDDLAIGNVVYAEGFAIAVVRGSTPWVRGDYQKINSANNEAGVFQRFFRQAYGFQLPSSGTPSIADTLAT